MLTRQLSSTSPPLTPSTTCPILSCHFKCNSFLEGVQQFLSNSVQNLGPLAAIACGARPEKGAILGSYAYWGFRPRYHQWLDQRIIIFMLPQQYSLCEFSLHIWLSAGCIEFGQKSPLPPFSQTSPEFQCSKKFCYNTKLVRLNSYISICIHVISWIMDFAHL